MKIKIPNGNPANASKGYALFLSLLPVLIMYGAYGISISTFMIFAGVPYAVLIILNTKNNGLSYILPIITYLLYTMFHNGSTHIYVLTTIAACIHLFAISCCGINMNYLVRYIKRIALFASAGTIFQRLYHTIFGVHIPLIISNLTYEDLSADYRFRITTGFGSITDSFYRPSAFFLEPAHMTQYLVIAIAFCLLVKAKDIKAASIISIGVIFSTSGMGIVFVLFAWGWYILTNIDKSKFLKSIRKCLISIIIIGMAFAALSQFEFFQSAFARIAAPTSTDSALWGRISYWDLYIASLSGWKLWIGQGISSLPEGYFTSFMTIIYCYGIIGCILFFSAELWMFVKSKGVSRFLILQHFFMIFIANQMGFISLIFQIGVIICCYLTTNKKELYRNILLYEM